MTMCMYVPGTYYDNAYVCTRYILCLCVCMYQVHIMTMCMYVPGTYYDYVYVCTRYIL